MALRSRTWLIVGLIIAVFAIALIANFAPFGGAGADEQAIRSEVTDFGNSFKSVSLSASSTLVKQDIQTAYSRFVTPELLAEWSSNPSNAPGRRASSPWPERIEVTSVTPQGSGYIVNGNIILMTSQEATQGGNAGSIPVILQLIKQDGKWLIAVYQEQATSTRPK